MEEPRFPRSIKKLNKLNVPLIYSEYYKGHASLEKNTVQHDNSYCFSHNPRTNGVWLKDEIPNLLENDIIVSRSTVTTLMHIAAYMGAKNIVLCGHDCGKLDDNLYTKGYIEKDWMLSKWSGIDSFLGKLEDESTLVRKYLQDRYDVNIYSINPFLNLGLEGHKFKTL